MSSSTSLDQRCEAFKKKVAQRLMLADTEIQQLNDYLLSLKAQFTELTDQKARIDNQIQQDVELKEGLRKKKRIMMQAKLAQLDADAQEQIKVLQNNQARIIGELQAEFEESLSQIQKVDQREIGKLQKRYDKQISELETQLERAEDISNYKDRTVNEDLREEKKSAEIMEEQIAQLQELYRQRQEERAQNLMKSKEQLVDCVRALEEGEEEHRQKMDQLKEKLRTDEKEYYDNVKQLKEQYKRQIPPLRKKVSAREKKFKEIQKKIQTFRTDNNNELQPLVNKHEKVKETLFMVTKTAKIQSEKDTKLVETQQKIENLKIVISDRESVLQKEMNINNDLKQRIVRLQFMKRTRQRRETLNL